MIRVNSSRTEIKELLSDLDENQEVEIKWLPAKYSTNPAVLSVKEFLKFASDKLIKMTVEDLTDVKKREKRIKGAAKEWKNKHYRTGTFKVAHKEVNTGLYFNSGRIPLVDADGEWKSVKIDSIISVKIGYKLYIIKNEQR